MGVFGGILLFSAGIVVGSSAVIVHQRDVRRASAQLRRENEHLKTCAWKDRLEFEALKAYGDGYYDGSRNPMSDVEKFADFLEARHIDYRFQKGSGNVERIQGRPRRAGH